MLYFSLLQIYLIEMVLEFDQWIFDYGQTRGSVFAEGVAVNLRLYYTSTYISIYSYAHTIVRPSTSSLIMSLF